MKSMSAIQKYRQDSAAAGGLRRSTTPKSTPPKSARVERPLSRWEQISNLTWVRRASILILLGLLWQIYARLER